MRKILGVEGDTDYDKLSLDVICEAKERLSSNGFDFKGRVLSPKTIKLMF